VADEGKLTRACELLTESPMMAVSEIARDLGYDSASYFSRVFRKRYGVTPAVYRKQHMGVGT
jgi:AraC-like DNA-binding protein